MPRRDLAALYGRTVLIVVAFAFVIGIVAGPLLQKAGLGSVVIAAQDHGSTPEFIRAKAAPTGTRRD